MKERIMNSLLFLVAMASMNICCKTVEPVDESYIPVISSSWTNLGNANHKFNFTSPQAGTSRGAFTGTEEYTDSTVSYPINGTFLNRSVSFKVSRWGRDTTYVGVFSADTLIDFGALKLSRRR